MKIPVKVRFFNKRFLNRIMIRIAGKRHSPIDLIRHRGRKSGNLYETPVIAARNGGIFFFALTYGTEVDWYRNVRAHKSAQLLHNGEWFQLSNPLPVEPAIGCKAFGQPAQFILRLLKVQDYFIMSTDDQVH